MLDLNNHLLKQRRSKETVLVTSNVDLTIYDDFTKEDGGITHEKNVMGRGITVNENGILRLYDAAVKDNQISEGDGAGVYVDKGGKLFLSGKVDLSTNTKKIPSAISSSNVFLNDAKIEIADDLINDNPIGVTYVNADGQNKGVFTEGLKEHGEISDFASEVSGKVISETADGEAEFADYEEYPVVVNGIRVNSSNRNNVLDDDKVKYDPKENILSLNNAGIKIVSSGTSYGNAGILYEGKKTLTISLTGDNTIETGDLARDGSRGIRSQGDVKIEGGSLKIDLSTENGSSATGIYLNSNYNLTLKNTKVEINVDSEDMYAYGIYGKDLSLTNSTLTINNESAGSSSIGAYLYGTVSSMDEASEIEVLSKVKGISDANSFKAVAQQYGAMVNTEASKEGASVWNKSRTLSTFKYLRIPGDLTVTFKDGKTVLEKQIVGKGQQAIKPNDPTKEGYTFQGWFKDGETEAYDFNTPVTSDFELTAKWKINEYTISFFNADGTPISEKVYPYGTKAALIEKPTPSKAEDEEYTYAFKGWKPEISDVTDDKEYTAVYDSTVKKYTITFKNGETVLQQSQEKYGTTPVYEGPTPSKPATETTVYTFKGWDPEIVSVKTDAVYNAEFSEKAKTYTIRFVNDDGEVLETMEVEHGKMPVPKDPEKAETAQYKYTFAGWDPALVAAREEAVYKATYTTTTKEYEIRFVDDDGKELSKTSYAYGTKASNIACPEIKSKTIDGKEYKFNGWNPPLMDVSGEQTYKAVYNVTDKKYTATWFYNTGEVIKGPTDPMTLDEINKAFPSDFGISPKMQEDENKEFTFLNWESEVDEDKATINYIAIYSSRPKRYTITWVIGETETKTDLNYGAPLKYGGTTPVKERKEGDHCSYEFDGWVDSEGKALEEHDTVKEERTLIAQFKEIPDTYRIRFLDDDNTVLKEMIVNYGTTADKLDAPVPTKAETAQYSYTFKEWKPAIGEVTGDQDYVAVYQEAKRSYNISFVMDDGKLISETAYEYGETPSCTDPVKTSDDQYEYTFKEWTPAITSVSGEATYVASFEKKEREYKVVYHANGGTGTMVDGTRLYSEALTLAKCEYSLAGSEFDGWYDQANGGNKIETVPAYSKDITVYAHWKGGEQLIQLDANGGTLPDDQKEIKARVGEPYPSLPTPSKEGVSFEGWYLADGDNPFGQEVIPGKTIVNGNTPLKARYQYTVTYISEKDKVFMTEFIFEDSKEPATKPESSPEKEGYTFMAWGAADGKPYDFEKPVKESLTLRAIYFRYAYEEGEKTWVKVGNGDLSFRFVRYELMNSEKESDKDLKADFDIDKKIYVDDVLLKESDYTCENGSLIAKLHDSLLNSLSVGNHTLKVVFTDGEISAPFVVKEREKPSTPSYIPPKTGDQ
ncbi:MAG: InlB B-repeat-containing protein, partial [Erysipelotrichaceae bacterium]|nr:InlB B-repeat-containing protein [Erysipelotrichaceae bacterium]